MNTKIKTSTEMSESASIKQAKKEVTLAASTPTSIKATSSGSKSKPTSSSSKSKSTKTTKPKVKKGKKS